LHSAIRIRVPARQRISDSNLSTKPRSIAFAIVIDSACEEGHLEIVELLCEHGADLDSVDNKGHTPIMLATLNGHGKTAYRLAQLGASLFVMDNNGTTMIEMAKTAFQELNELEW
jgi:ankyrin repeat protein